MSNRMLGALSRDLSLVWRKVLLLAAVLAGFLLIGLLEYLLLLFTTISIPVLLAIAVVLNALLIVRLIGRSADVGLTGAGLHRLLNTLFGLFCYLGFVFQLAVIFYFSYLIDGNAAVLTQGTLDLVQAGQVPAMQHVRNLFNHVLPHFYEFPVNLGVMPAIQHFVGKFTDLFLLAFIVEKTFGGSASAG